MVAMVTILCVCVCVSVCAFWPETGSHGRTYPGENRAIEVDD